MRIKCPHCNGKGFSEINSTLNMTCGWCMGQGELDIEVVPAKENMTNEEWLQTATTEQLAEWIVHLADDCTMQHECDLCNSWCDEKRVMEWLKQPHTPIS